MSNRTPLNSTPSGEGSTALLLEDTSGVGERFIENFEHFMEMKKRQAVVDLLQEEFPQLVEDTTFVEKVVQKLGPDMVAEKRFVFLVMNPNLKV